MSTSKTQKHEEKGTSKWQQALAGLSRDLWIAVLDIVAVNLSYFLALMIRFYVNHEFRPTVSYYLSDFLRFAPFYTVICIVVFALCKLYNGIWRYAGINDMNRIIIASAITCAVQVIGTLIFIRRMPITYYVIGALLQFVFVSIIRFAYRFIIVEHQRIANRHLPCVNVMVVGTGEMGRRVVKQMEDLNAFRPVCVIDQKSDTDGKTFDGIPVLGGGAQMERAIEKFDVKAVIIADAALSSASRKNIQSLCEVKGLELQDYTGFLSNLSGRVSLTGLLEVTRCPVVVRQKEQTAEYSNGMEALSHLTDRFTVTDISVEGQKLIIDLMENITEAYAGYDAWLKKHKEETGEEISFF